jgi:hypothetical protein
MTRELVSRSAWWRRARSMRWADGSAYTPCRVYLAKLWSGDAICACSSCTTIQNRNSRINLSVRGAREPNRLDAQQLNCASEVLTYADMSRIFNGAPRSSLAAVSFALGAASGQLLLRIFSILYLENPLSNLDLQRPSAFLDDVLCKVHQLDIRS